MSAGREVNAAYRPEGFLHNEVPINQGTENIQDTAYICRMDIWPVAAFASTEYVAMKKAAPRMTTRERFSLMRAPGSD